MPSEKAAASKQSLAELEAKLPGALSANEVIQLSAARTERHQQEAQALREKLAQNPSLFADKATQSQLLQQARDAETARPAQAALAAAGTPLAADLLYEVWTGTPGRTDSTELETHEPKCRGCALTSVFGRQHSGATRSRCHRRPHGGAGRARRWDDSKASNR